MELITTVSLITGIITGLKTIKDLVPGGRTEIKKEDAEELGKQLVKFEKEIIGLADLAGMVQSYRRLHEDSLILGEGANNAVKTILTILMDPEAIAIDPIASSTLSDVAGRFSKLDSSFTVIRQDIDNSDQGTITAHISQLSSSVGRAGGYVDSKKYEEYKKELYKIGEAAVKVSGLTGSRVESLLRELERLSRRR